MMLCDRGERTKSELEGKRTTIARSKGKEPQGVGGRKEIKQIGGEREEE